MRDACHGLDYAHRAGVVHRDVKPGNLLIADETGTTKLADFGIAKAAEQTRITQVGSVLGTAAYLSPEQARGEEAGPASDIYSLGVCAYQFLTGRLPHEYASLTELALKQQNDTVEPITALPARGAARSSTARSASASSASPAMRYASALELAEALEAGASGEDTDATRALAAGRRDRRHLMRCALRRLRHQTRARRRAAAPPERRRRPARRDAPRAPASEAGAGRRAASSALALLAALAAIVVVALVLLTANDNTVQAPRRQRPLAADPGAPRLPGRALRLVRLLAGEHALDRTPRAPRRRSRRERPPSAGP